MPTPFRQSRRVRRLRQAPRTIDRAHPPHGARGAGRGDRAQARLDSRWWWFHCFALVSFSWGPSWRSMRESSSRSSIRFWPCSWPRSAPRWWSWPGWRWSVGAHATCSAASFPMTSCEEVLGQTGSDPRLGGSRRTCTVLFADLRGFTTLCEELEPEQALELMNTLSRAHDRGDPCSRWHAPGLYGRPDRGRIRCTGCARRPRRRGARGRPRDHRPAARRAQRLDPLSWAGRDLQAGGGAEQRPRHGGQRGLGGPHGLHGDRRRGEPGLARGRGNKGIRRTRSS